MIVPDYEGLTSAFGARVQAGHAILDGIRAAESFAPAGLDGAATRVGIWGYSGGSLASGAAAELAPAYAPELNIRGVAEGGVPADVHAVFDNVNGNASFVFLDLEASVGAAAMYSNLFYDMNPNPGNGYLGGPSHSGLAAVLNETGQAIAAQYRAGQSPTPPSGDVSAYTWCGCNPADAPAEFPGIAQLLTLDTMGRPEHAPSVPFYIYEAYFDELVPFHGVSALVATYCADGLPVSFHVDPTTEHVSAAVTNAPSAVAYLTAVFRGVTPSTCGLPFDGGAPDPPVNAGSVLKGQL